MWCSFIYLNHLGVILSILGRGKSSIVGDRYCCLVRGSCITKGLRFCTSIRVCGVYLLANVPARLGLIAPSASYSNEVTNSPLYVNGINFSDFLIQQKENKNKNKTSILKTQFGLESDVVRDTVMGVLTGYAGVNSVDKLISELEGLVALFVVIQSCVNVRGVTSAILLYMRNKFDTSVFSVLSGYFTKCMITTQDGIENDEDPQWLTFIKRLKDDWIGCRASGLFENFAKALSLLVIAGVTKASNLTFAIGDFKVIEPHLVSKIGNASDLVSALCEVVEFFGSRCYHVWKSGSLRPLFSRTLESAEIEVECAEIMKWWKLLRNGNLTKIEGVDEHDFLVRLESITTNVRNMTLMATGINKKLLEAKYRELLDIINNYTVCKVNSGIKPAPFVCSFFGGTAVGKSTASEQVSHYLKCVAGLSTDDQFVYTHVSGKKHWDGARSDMLELKLDDHANTKSDYVESSPCDVIIKVCNNVPYSPPMADLAEKGKVFIEPALVTLTTNVQHLDAYVYSNCPISIQRRMHYNITVRPMPEFTKENGALDSAKLIEHYSDENGIHNPPVYDNEAWAFDVYKVVPAPTMDGLGTYVLEKDDNGKELWAVSMHELLNFLGDKFLQHRDIQKKITASLKNATKLDMCPHEGCNQLKGVCLAHPVPQSGFEPLLEFARGFVVGRVATASAISTLVAARALYDQTEWIHYVPECVFSHRYFEYAVMLSRRHSLYLRYRSTLGLYSLCSLILYLIFACYITNFAANLVVLSCSVLAYFYGLTFMIRIFRATFLRELRNSSVMNEVQRDARENAINQMLKTAGVFGALYLFCKAYSRLRRLATQGSLEPRTQEDVDKRDAEDNPWIEVAKRPLPMSNESKCVDTERLEAMVDKNLLYGSIHLGDENGMLNAMALTSNVLLIPMHYFDEFGDELECTFRKRNPEGGGGKFRTHLSKEASYHIPNTDFAVCYTPSGGSFKNLIRYLPTGYSHALPFRLLWRQKDGEILKGKGLTSPQEVETSRRYHGGLYKNLTIDTFGGLCGAVLVSETRGSVILGFHLGGTAGTTHGCYGTLTQQQALGAIEKIRNLEGICISGAEGTFPTEVLGFPTCSNEPLHKKSPLKFFKQSPQFEYYGSCPGRATSRSDVKVTPISEHIIDVCGVPNIYRPPAMLPEWKAWQTCLSNAAEPAREYPYGLLKMAVQDYKEDLLPIFSSPLWRNTKPLTQTEALCGINGVKFIDAVKLQTAVGFPLTGPKRRFVEDLEPTEEFPNMREITPEMLEEIDRCRSCYRRGERAYPGIKACKKDEILTKDKCRVFFGMAMPITCLIREWFLPLVRVLQMNPLKSECAVGINAHGPEWEEFHQHVHKFGEDRLIGGDYGKYDQKLSSQLILTAFRILIDFARVCDYPDETIRMMEALSGDIAFAIIAFNGDLIGLIAGLHVSGNSLTVILNGIAGALNLRCAFYSIFPPINGVRKKFRDNVSLMTYGDDNAGSVRKGMEAFNIKSCSEFLARFGQIYTMPDKESELVPFLDKDNFEFLKRKSVYHPALGQHIGALIDASIYKSLHCFLRPKGCEMTEEFASALNVDTALREWFNHGRDKYEHQRKLMKQVVEKADITHMCTRLEYTYEDCVVEWREKYDENYVAFPKLSLDDSSSDTG